MNIPHVIIGAGFSRLKVARPLRNAPVQIILIDKRKIKSYQQ
jgi:NADH dehydrogenase FAD-containing subunit